MEPQGRGSLVELRVGGAKVKPTGQGAEVEREKQRPEAEPKDLLDLARVVSAPEASPYCRVTQGSGKGSRRTAKAGLENWQYQIVEVEE